MPHRSKVRPRTTSHRRALIATVAVIIAAAVTSAWVAHRRRPPLPDLNRLGAMAPEIDTLVRQKARDIDAEPGDAQRWGEFGMACEANGLVAPAGQAYRTASDLDATNPRWPYRLAAVDARAGDTNAAVDDLRRAAMLDASYAPIHWRLGLLLLDANDLDGAAREFARATDMNPADAAGWIGVARVDMQRGDNTAAVRTLERLLAREPGNRYAMQLLGTSLERIGRHDEAAALLTAGTAEQPSWSDPWTDEMLDWRRGFAVRLKDATSYFANGDHDRAIHLLEQLVGEKPDDVPLLAHLGEAYIAAHHYDEGTRALERVVAREPNRNDAWVRLASGYVQEGRFSEARAALDRALALDAAYAPAQETLGLLLWRTGDESAALTAMRAASNLDPRNTRVLVWAGMIQTNIGRIPDAVESFTRATQLDPTLVPAWLGVANARMSEGDLAAADAALARATMLAGDLPAVRQTADRLHELQSTRERTAAARRR